MFPSILRTKNSAVQDVTEDDMQRDQTIEKKCPQCGNKEMKYYTLQLRSVDEGSTVFYTCELCGHKYDFYRSLSWVRDADSLRTVGRIRIIEWDMILV
jgi:RNase P subunit RPR2